MIIKIKTRKTASYKKLLEYLLNDRERLFDDEKKSFVLKHNIRGNSIEKWVEQFKENETHRKNKRKDSVLLSHEILSWHREDAKNISIEKMEDMAREYIRLRNPNGMYVAVPHTDKDHYHVHVCASGLEYHSGKSMRMTKAEFAELKKKTMNYMQEKYPELSRSPVEHGRSGMKKGMALSDTDYRIKLRTGRESDKQKIVSILKACYKKAESKEEFFRLIYENGLKTYSRSEKLTGILYAGRKFRLSRLGLTPDILLELDVEVKRGRELERVRGKKRERGRELER